MKQLHFIYIVIALASFPTPSAVSRGPPGSRSDLQAAPPSRLDGPSPAELEEMEEEDGQDDQVVGSSQAISQAVPQAPQAQVVAPVAEAVVAPAAAQAQAAVVQTSADTPASAQGPAAQTSDSEFLPPSQEDLAEESVTAAVPDTPLAPEPVAPVQMSPQRPPTSSFLKSHADLGLMTLSGATAGKPLAEQPKHSAEVPHRAASSYGDAASVKTLFPSTLPISIKSPSTRNVSAVTALHAEPKNGFDAAASDGNSCNPPCVEGRGVCNDNMCFCKSPYTGSTCSHKVSALIRVKYPMLVASSIVCLVLGALAAQIIHGFIARRQEKRLVYLGDGLVRQELWTPPDNSKKKSSS